MRNRQVVGQASNASTAGNALGEVGTATQQGAENVVGAIGRLESQLRGNFERIAGEIDTLAAQVGNSRN